VVQNCCTLADDVQFTSGWEEEGDRKFVDTLLIGTLNLWIHCLEGR